jgi:high-affinity Fe2+/Pb2+ permease
MGVFNGLKMATKRIMALIAGIPIAILGGYLVYESYASEASSRLLGKVSIVLALIGLGLVLYGLTGSAKKTEADKKSGGS